MKKKRKHCKKGFGRITIIFWVLTFIIFWALAFAPIISTQGHLIVVNGGLSGVEAFGFDNLNLIIGIVLFAFIMFLSFGDVGTG